MSVKIPNKYLVLLFLGVVLGLLTLGWVLGRRNGVNSQKPSMEALGEQISHFEAIVADQKVDISQKAQEITSQKKALKELGLENADLKALNIKKTNEINQLKFRIDTLLEDIGHGGQIITVTDTVYQTPKNAILLPFDFSKKDKWLDLRGNFDENGKLGVKLGMEIEITAIAGYPRKSKEPTLTVYTDNPYIKTVGVKSFKTDFKPPKKYGIGVMIGYGVSTKYPMEPSIVIGAGLSYNIIRF